MNAQGDQDTVQHNCEHINIVHVVFSWTPQCISQNASIYKLEKNITN